MVKKDFVKRVSEEVGMTQKDVEAVFDSICKNTKKIVLEEGEKLSFIGLGTFRQNVSKAREGRNPQTGATIQIASKTTIKFKQS